MRRVGFKRRRTGFRAKRPAQRLIRFRSLNTTNSGISSQIYLHSQGSNASTMTSMRLDIGSDSLASGEFIRYVLLYVPENLEPTSFPMTTSSDNIVEPAENVLIAGQLNSVNLQDHKWCRVSKKLKEGDQLILYAITSDNANTPTVSLQFEASILG